MKSLAVQGAREVVHVGSRLRNARLERRYTLDQVAQLSGMTKGFLSRVERDLTSPSVASLVTLCQVLQIEIGSLFLEPRTTLVRLEDAPEVALEGHDIDQRLITGQNERAVQVVRSVSRPGGGAHTRLYALDVETEVVHVQQGRIEVTIGDDVFVLDTGDTLTFSGREPHHWQNVADDESIVLFVLVPGNGPNPRTVPSRG